ncbi:LppX_LprAFG lipoprotein [Streptomyces albofaciens]|uniref:LppX_LprAFG lipoprotein n=1 Tax=Streptomyces albofaciens TaxID=66866 RepID=UPI00142ECDC6|nr:LppX_LprAFG lipoprotein [Streptomyces albofaciens]
MAAAGALSLAAVAGCGGTDDKASGKPSDRQSASPAAPGGAADGPQAVRAAHQKTTDARTAKMTLVTKAQSGGTNAEVRGSGVVDLAKGNSELVLLTGNSQIHQRMVEGILYQQPPAAQRKQLPQGKSWLKVDVKKLLRQTGGSTQYEDPTSSFNYIKGISDKDVEKVGTETVDGTATTHYKVSVDVAELAKDNARQAKQLRAQLGDRLPLDVWLDGQGRLRQEKVEVKPRAGQQGNSGGRTAVTTTLKFSDFGTDVNVTAPPAKDTVDITDKAVKAAQQEQGRQTQQG